MDFGMDNRRSRRLRPVVELVVVVVVWPIGMPNLSKTWTEVFDAMGTSHDP